MGTLRKLTGQAAASDAASSATNSANAQFAEAKAALNPFIQAGVSGLADLNALRANPSMVSQLPGYLFELDQGTQAITRKAAASGFRGSGNVLFELQKFGQGLASKSYADEFSRRYGLAQLGQSAAASLSGASVQTGNTIGNIANSFGESSVKAGTAGLDQLTNIAGTATGIAFGLSDRRLKTDIEKVVSGKSGINIYSFKFKGHNCTNIGVMADEVEKVLPEAVRTNSHGYKEVNYTLVQEYLNV